MGNGPITDDTKTEDSTSARDMFQTRSRAVSAWALIAALAILFEPGTSFAAGCVSDSDCKGVRICEAGRCVDPRAPAGPQPAPAPARPAQTTAAARAPAPPVAAPTPPQPAAAAAAAPAPAPADAAPAQVVSGPAENPAAAPQSGAACYPACRTGFTCSQGACISLCNPACAAGQTCSATGECVTSAAAAPPVGEADAGWAQEAAIVGYVLTPVTVGVGIAGAATEGGAGIGLGATTTVLVGAGVPIISAGGASARNHPDVTGSRTLRITSWISYGLCLGDALTMIGLGLADADVAVAPRYIAVGLGALTLSTMTLDAAMSANQAKAVAQRTAARVPEWQIIPFVSPTFNATRSDLPGTKADGCMAGVMGRF
jgi:hypothetical protein